MRMGCNAGHLFCSDCARFRAFADFPRFTSKWHGFARALPSRADRKTCNFRPKKKAASLVLKENAWSMKRTPSLAIACCLFVGFCAPFASAQITNTNWSAFDDFYVNVPAPGGYPQSAWIANAGTIPFDTGLTNANAWGYAGGNFNGSGAPSSVGTYVSAGILYPLTSGGTYAGSGESYLTGGTSYWIGY